jgi:hypothetical protein
MDYTYLIEKEGNINQGHIIGFIYILCYHINAESKYPFIQFMLEKLPSYYGLVEEEFILPSVLISSYNDNIEENVIQQIQQSLLSIGCDISSLDNSMYKGIINDSDYKNYALVNITGIDINYLKLYRKNAIWFGLPSEIMNNKHICNIPIDEVTSALFCNKPTLSLIHNAHTNKPYNIPDAVYSGSEYKEVEYNSIFGMRKKKIYEEYGEYFYFFRNFKHAVKEGGWVKEGGTQFIDMNNKKITHSVSDRLLVDNEYGRYIRGGINRYALFVENSQIIYLDKPITDELINETGCLFIGLSADIKQDILVNEYELFFPISFHELNKSLLGQSYQNDDTEYMIS